jgi:hypothetical protein
VGSTGKCSVAQGDPDDLGAPAREEAIELVAVLATANWTNRFDDGLQTPPG